MSLLSRIFGGGTATEERLAKCKLCGQQFPASVLQAHILAESNEARDYTINMISKQHPDWVASDGACPKCWEYYKQL